MRRIGGGSGGNTDIKTAAETQTNEHIGWALYSEPGERLVCQRPNIEYAMRCASSLARSVSVLTWWREAARCARSVV